MTRLLNLLRSYWALVRKPLSKADKEEAQVW
jgi:hypothetical protein